MRGDTCAEGIEGEGGVFYLFEAIWAENFRAAFGGDVFVVSFGGFGGWCEEGCWQGGAFLEGGRERVVEEGACCAIFFPSAACEVAADDGFDGEGLEFAHEHGAWGEVCVLGAEGGQHGGIMVGHEVGGHDGGCLRKPPEADLGEKDAFAWDAVGHHDVEGRDSVCGDDDELVAKVENFADLAGCDFGKRQARDGHLCSLRQEFAEVCDIHWRGIKTKVAKLASARWLRVGLPFYAVLLCGACGEGEVCGARVALAGEEGDGRECGLVGRVGEVLGF